MILSEIVFPRQFFEKLKKGYDFNPHELAKKGIVLSFLFDNKDEKEKFKSDFIYSFGDFRTILLDEDEYIKNFKRYCEIIRENEKIPRNFAFWIFENSLYLSEILSESKIRDLEEDNKEYNQAYCSEVEIEFKENNKNLATYFLLFSTHKDLLTEDLIDMYFEDFMNRFRYLISKNNHKNIPRKERDNITSSIRLEVLKRDNYSCQICGNNKENGAILHVDHIIPVSKGGIDEMSNLRTLCRNCNLSKSDRIYSNGEK